MFEFLIGNSFLSGVLAFIIVLIPAVIVHELGHFFAARAVGITVLEFGIGLPPKAMRLFMWRETEFTLNWIPLGGFVRPFGEDMIREVERDEASPESSAEATPQYDALYSERQILAERGVENPVSIYDVKPLPRIFFMLAGAIGNFIFAIVIFVAVALMGLPQVVGVQYLLIESEPAVLDAGLQETDWLQQIDGRNIESLATLVSALREREGQTVTATVQRLQESNIYRPEQIDLVVTPELVALWEQISGYVRVVRVDEGSPAEDAGLLVGDLIAGIDGISFADDAQPVSTLQALTNEAAGRPVELSILRDGEMLTLNLTPRENPPERQGRIGIQIGGEWTTPDEAVVFVQISNQDYVPQSLTTAIQYGWDSTVEVLGLIAAFPSRLLQGDTEPGESRLIGPIGVSQLGSELLQGSIQENNAFAFLRFIALISIALGITNLLPIPALDGGRIVFALIELVRGKPVPPEREGYVHMIGLIFILSLGILIIINDVMNPVTDLLR